MTLLTRATLDARRFTPGQLRALYHGVEIDDHIDPQAQPPARVMLDFDEALLADAFRICRQLWRDDRDDTELRRLLLLLREHRDLAPADRASFKHIRAKLKLLRFAFALLGRHHRYPRVTDWVTTALGHIQDAFKSGQRARVAWKVATTRLLLAPGVAALFHREHDRIALASATDFRRYLARELARLDQFVSAATVTGAQYHAARKIVSRVVAFYVVLEVLEPSGESAAMMRALATINGQMGALHDDLVAHRVGGTQDYRRDHFTIAADLRDRIAAVLATYRASGLFADASA